MRRGRSRGRSDVPWENVLGGGTRRQATMG